MEEKENNRLNRNTAKQRFLEPKVLFHFLFLTLYLLKFNRNSQVCKQKEKS